MALAAGTHLGPYEILGPLGAGGMGEVYRARDPRLGREVAVKVLPASLASDADRLRRFEQEARAAGLLNHPNILAIYDIGTHEGAPYVVSELLEGETLRERLGEGALPPRKAADYALQVARGLDAAHEKGIVHRDLKPENLFITHDGRVKILDFGLAKLTRPAEAPGSATSIPTTPSVTDPGLVMGTVGYMSPEQVRAKPTDARSDIFSFGVILYEMLSGRRAFQGDTSVETMNAILKEEPPELSTFGRNLAPGFERIVTHCLEKNPEERFQSARDLAFNLESLSGISGATASVPAEALRPPPWLMAWKPWAVTVGVGVLVAAAFIAGKRLGTAPSFQPPTYHRLTFRRGPIFSARFAPDGKTVVYAAAWDGGATDLYTERLEFPESRPVGMPGTNLLAISSTGEMAVCIRGVRGPHGSYRGTLARIPLAGGAPREVLDDVEGADWSPDGTNLAVVHVVNGKRQLEYPIGKVLYETTGWISHARISLRGDKIAFLDHPVWGDDRGSVAVVDLAGHVTTLSTDWASEEGLAWTPKGDEIWFAATQGGVGRALYGVSLGGKLRSLARIPGGVTIQDIFPDGRVLLTSENERVGIMGVGPGETKERDLSWLDWSFPHDISQDGKTLLFDEEGEGGGPNYSVCIRPTNGGPPVRLGEGHALSLSPDGKWALAVILSPPEKLVMLPTGAGSPRTLEANNLEHYTAAVWFPDGKRILISAAEPGHRYRTYVQNAEGGPPKPVAPEGIAAFALFPALSPDGKRFVAVDADQHWWIYPVESGKPEQVEGLGANDLVIEWTQDENALYIADPNQVPEKVFKLNLTTHQKQLWKTLAPTDRAGLVNAFPVAVSADGKAYVYSTDVVLDDLYLVEGLK